jgi:hypothetical protein
LTPKIFFSSLEKSVADLNKSVTDFLLFLYSFSKKKIRKIGGQPIYIGGRFCIKKFWMATGLVGGRLYNIGSRFGTPTRVIGGRLTHIGGRSAPL